MRRWIGVALVAAGCGRIDFLAIASTDAGADAVPAMSTCAGVSVLLCDGFEEGSLSQWPVLQQASGTVAIDGSVAYRGTHSLHAHGNPTATGQMKALITQQSILAAPPPQLFLRAFVLAPAPRPADQFTWAELGQSVPPYDWNDFSYANAAGFPFFSNAATGSAQYTTSASSFPIATWACLEWEIDFSAPQQMRAWRDDVEVTDLAVQEATQASPTFANLELGLFFTKPNVAHAAYDLWIDEIIVDDQRIGCAK